MKTLTRVIYMTLFNVSMALLALMYWVAINIYVVIYNYIHREK